MTKLKSLVNKHRNQNDTVTRSIILRPNGSLWRSSVGVVSFGQQLITRRRGRPHQRSVSSKKDRRRRSYSKKIKCRKSLTQRQTQETEETTKRKSRAVALRHATGAFEWSVVACYRRQDWLPFDVISSFVFRRHKSPREPARETSAGKKDFG